MSDQPTLMVVGCRRRGRPPRAETRATKRVEFLVTPDERASLQKVAEAQGYRSVAAAIRDACNAFVDDFGGRVVFTPSGDSFKKKPPL